MAVSQYIAGTETISTTEYSLALDANYNPATPATDDGAFQAFIDFSAVVVGDEFEIKVYETILSGGTQRLLFSASITQPCVWVSPTLIFLHGWDITLDKLAGTDRSIDWSIRKA